MKRVAVTSIITLCSLIVLLMTLTLSGCVMPATPEAIQEGEVREAIAAWDDAFNAGDLDRVMKLYMEEVVSMPPNLPAREGKAALEADFQFIFGEFIVHHETSIVDIKVSGDLAIEQSRYTMTLTPKAGGDTITEVGKHVMVRQKIGNEWKILWEIWNTDEPLPGQ